MSMSFLSVCSGIEAASVAWEPLGWKACAFAEIEKFPSAVLAHHWPDVPNLGDMTKHNEWPNTLRPDVIVGGTPCQAFSVAGLRQGLADPRGNLTLTFLSIIEQYRPAWVVWENVPGVLSDRTGAFGAFLGGLGELGYGFAYRVLDAQYFGVAQRRRRVFVVGHFGDWRRAAAVLFERESLRGDSPPSREKGERVAATITSGPPSGGPAHGQLSGHARETNLIPEVAGCLRGGWPAECAPTLNAHFGEKQGLEDQHINGGAGLFVQAVAFSCKDRGEDAGPISPTLRSMTHDGSHANGGGQVAVAYRTSGNCGAWETGDRTDAITTATDPFSHVLRTPTAVRRLTPRECERLQGFPDDHTIVPWRGKMAPDGPRYKALGNSMAVPVMRWIGERISQMNTNPNPTT